MKVILIFQKNSVPKKNHNIFKRFIHFLQSECPLQNSVKITFVGDREGNMTTGGRYDDSNIFVLGGKRLIRDMFRTLAHEWIHEYQISVLGREKGPQIGGRNEDEANAFAGRLVKMFEKKFPFLQKNMYE
jgi:hypothetical protein